MVTMNEASPDSQGNIKKAIPVILFFFIFALIIDNSFKLISVEIANDLNVSVTTVSWQATLAGLVIGIGAVVYSSLSDTISIRSLLNAGIILIVMGSLLGYIFSDSFLMILIARVIQTAGLAAAETLYLVFVTKHLPKNEQKKFLGFSTSSYSLSLIFGSLAGGYVSTYLHWTTLFLIPLLSLLLIPLISKYLPKEKARRSHLDIIGLVLIAAIATSIMLFIANFNWFYILIFAASLTIFLMYISKKTNSIIHISFFQNRHYMYTLIVAFVIYSVQLGYIFLFPFVLQGLYGLQLDTISLLLLPGYVTAVIVGALSGKIANVLTSRQTIVLAMSGIIVSLIIPGVLINGPVIVFVLSMMLFSGAFALMYAPLLERCVSTISVERTGTAIGFYNLTLNVAASIGIAYTAVMIDKFEFNVVLYSLTAISVLAIVLYWGLGRKMSTSA